MSDKNNYIKHLIANGLTSGDKLVKNNKNGTIGNKIFEITEITDTEIKLSCIQINKPTAEQSENIAKELSEEIIINISECDTFPEFVIYKKNSDLTSARKEHKTDKYLTQ